MVELLIVLAVTLLLVALNGMFVAAEFSIIGASRTTLAGQSLLGDTRARLASEIVEEPRRLDQYIAIAQIGITFSSLALGMYGEHGSSAMPSWPRAYLRPMRCCPPMELRRSSRFRS